MRDLLKSVLPAFIALIGTILVALLGYRQWNRQQAAARSSEFKSEKKNAYKELWDKLETIHVRLRTGAVGKPEFQSLVVEINSYILKNELYFDSPDKRLANLYLEKLRDFTTLIAKCDSVSAKEKLYNTNEIPDEITKALPAIAKSQEELNTLREDIRSRCRRALTED